MLILPRDRRRRLPGVSLAHLVSSSAPRLHWRALRVSSKCNFARRAFSSNSFKRASARPLKAHPRASSASFSWQQIRARGPPKLSARLQTTPATPFLRIVAHSYEPPAGRPASIRGLVLAQQLLELVAAPSESVERVINGLCKAASCSSLETCCCFVVSSMARPRPLVLFSLSAILATSDSYCPATSDSLLQSDLGQ